MECPRCWRWDSHSLLCYLSASRALERLQKRAEGMDSGSLVDPPSDARIGRSSRGPLRHRSPFRLLSRLSRSCSRQGQA